MTSLSGGPERTSTTGPFVTNKPVKLTASSSEPPPLFLKSRMMPETFSCSSFLIRRRTSAVVLFSDRSHCHRADQPWRRMIGRSIIPRRLVPPWPSGTRTSSALASSSSNLISSRIKVTTRRTLGSSAGMMVGELGAFRAANHLDDLGQIHVHHVHGRLPALGDGNDAGLWG